jgi:hypothetical protein
MPRNATSLDEQMLLEACRFGGNDSLIVEYLKQMKFETSTLQQALITIQASATVHEVGLQSNATQIIQRRLLRSQK